jgi:hypothetical protein
MNNLTRYDRDKADIDIWRILLISVYAMIFIVGLLANYFGWD